MLDALLRNIRGHTEPMLVPDIPPSLPALTSVTFSCMSPHPGRALWRKVSAVDNWKKQNAESL